MTDDVRDMLETLADYLEEAHEADVEDDHGKDDLTVYPCSYCEAIKKARMLLVKERTS